MSAQPVQHHPGPVPAIPKTIDAIAVALSAAKRMAFYAEIGQTDAAELESAIERWWTDALLDQVPGREERLANVMAGGTWSRSTRSPPARRRPPGEPAPPPPRLDALLRGGPGHRH
jgi:hypothetical protein